VGTIKINWLPRSLRDRKHTKRKATEKSDWENGEQRKRREMELEGCHGLGHWWQQRNWVLIIVFYLSFSFSDESR
jgi:hypothetical protein